MTAKSVAAAMMERRILINRTSETVLRFLPPYILGKSHVDIAVAALDDILHQHAPAESSAVHEDAAETSPREAPKLAANASLLKPALSPQSLPPARSPWPQSRWPAATSAPSPISPPARSRPCSNWRTPSRRARATIAMRSTRSRW